MNRMRDRKTASGRSRATAWYALISLVLAGVGFGPALRADDATGPGGGRAIRLSYAEGQVKVTQGGQVLAEQATVNAPLFEGMEVSTGDDGRAEIQFEDGSVARLSPNSVVSLTTLRGEEANGDAEITLDSGLGYFELQGSGQFGQMNVHFGDSAVSASGFTVLRVNMDTPPGEVAVFSGNAHLEGTNGALAMDLHGGESAKLNPGDLSHSVVSENIEPDSWDAWNSDRDQALNAEAGASTGAGNSIAPNESQNPAWNDLDANGNWYDVPGQGYVWSPYEAANAGWDPYGYGNWMYTPGYGYLWASGYPWGYLPYQCGAWNFYDGFGWGWSPGFGGCQPWWVGGFYAGPRFGGFLPGGYRVPHRPLPPRIPGRGHPIPMIAVHQRMNNTVASLPLRDRNTPVNIAGSTVHAMRPLTMRPEFQRPAAEFAEHESHVYSNANPGFSTAPRPGNAINMNRGSYAAAPENNQNHATPPAPVVRSYSPPPTHNAPPPSSAPANHPSYNGGGAPRGGGGPPPSMGGGAPRGGGNMGGGGMGGGGGASHGGGSGGGGGGGGHH